MSFKNVLTVLLCYYACSGSAKLACYVCNGQSVKSGAYCTNDNLCAGNSCTFDGKLSGEWAAGCSNETIGAGVTVCIIKQAEQNFTCNCGDSFCNDVNKITTVLDKRLPNGTSFVPKLPTNLTKKCLQCGLLNVPPIGVINVTCGLTNTCKGSFCITKRGQYPHSYCGTDWNPMVEGCVSKPDQDEVCACMQNYCNFPYPQQTTTTTVTPAPTQPPTPAPTKPPTPATTLPPTPPPTKPPTPVMTTKTPTVVTTPVHPPVATTTTASGGSVNTSDCVYGRFGKNDQMVKTATALKNMVKNRFGNSSAVQSFLNNIDQHICAYSGP
ncbi:unnamed protein product [Anisakis simplex]|uniref:Phospholipase A(2) n=1 Tax=Anisakis simplex TaxID=6269 RepID=A0A0M3JY63_ANISI|nr:unnamed protein product [Anisakis simplex]